MSLLEYLTRQRIEFETHLHEPAFTAQRRARVLHHLGGAVTKALLLHGPEGFFVVVQPVLARLDLAAMARVFGGPVRLASSDEAWRLFRDCEWGVISPFGNRYGLPVFVDAALTEDARVVLEGQTRAEAIELRCRDLERLTGAFRVAF